MPQLPDNQQGRVAAI